MTDRPKVVPPHVGAEVEAMQAHRDAMLSSPGTPRARPVDPTALSWWFPKIEAAGVPVPKTILVDMTPEARETIWAAFDGKDAGDPRPFLAKLQDACDSLGWPVFLRTDMTSGKHGWKRNCFVERGANLFSHVMGIVEYSEVVSFVGLPWDRWAVREFLPTMPVGVCPGYDDMPICREFRFFVNDGRVLCWHPYWPAHALERGGAVFDAGHDPSTFERPTEIDELTALAAKAGAAVGGYWSIDVLETRRGWFVTDMAEAYKSFHWEGCPHSAE